VLSVKLPRLDEWNGRRRSLAERYRAALADVVAVPDEAPERHHVFHLFVIRTPERDALARELERRGVGTLVHYPRAVHEHPAYRELARPGRLTRSERLAREVLSLPLYPELSDDEAAAVVAAVRDACDV
jgi:dTDP-3-amino-3,4,6-trideoxy-alpha-D-glucose transaminase